MFYSIILIPVSGKAFQICGHHFDFPADLQGDPHYNYKENFPRMLKREKKISIVFLANVGAELLSEIAGGRGKTTFEQKKKIVLFGFPSEKILEKFSFNH